MTSVGSTLTKTTPTSPGRFSAPLAFHSSAVPRCLMSIGSSAPTPALSHPLQYDGDALADADAHGDERIASAGALQLARGSQRKARARGAQRMAHGDGAAIGIDASVVSRKAKALEARQHLGGKRFIDLDQVHVL